MAGEFHWLHQVGVDKRGDIYTAEVDTGKRIQKLSAAALWAAAARASAPSAAPVL
jgi:hypothetical protein